MTVKYTTHYKVWLFFVGFLVAVVFSFAASHVVNMWYDAYAAHRDLKKITHELRMTEDCYRALELDITVPFKCAQYMTTGEVK